MTTQFQFKIQNLLSIKDNILSGPMSPFLFAQEMAKSEGENFNRLARLCCQDETVHQYRENGGFTGHDTLIIGTQYQNDLFLSLWIDEGVKGVPVAMAFQSHRDILITPIYYQKKYYRKLTEEQIQQIFDFLFDNPHLIEPQQKTDNKNTKNPE